MKSIFVYNPESGKGKIKKNLNYILRRLKEKYGDVDVVETTHPSHATELARASAGVYDYFFICGGDGTLDEVIDGLGEAENKPIIGYIPCGTVNDVAVSLGISKNIKKATDTLINGMPYAHDIFKANDRYGIYVCCSGLFTKASYQTKRKEKKMFGKLPYFIDGVKDIFTAKPMHVKIENGSQTIEKDCALMLIVNSRSVAGFKFNKNAKLDDGQVEVVLFPSGKNKVNLKDILRCVKVFVFGLEKSKNDKNITYLKASNLKVDLSSENVNIDGEKVGINNFNLKVLNKSVKILTDGKNDDSGEPTL